MKLLCLMLLSLVLIGCPAGSGTGKSQSSPPSMVQFADLLDEARARPGQDTYYSPPSLFEQLNLKELVRDFAQALAKGPIDVKTFQRRFRESSLQLQEVKVGEETCYAIFESGDKWRGSGVYVFRAGDVPEVLLQAPHSFHDLHTGDLVMKTFMLTKSRAMYVNSIHRYRSHPGENPSDVSHPADMAHNTDSVFYLMSVEYLRTVTDALVVQFHGYRDKSLKSQGFEIVVSDGTDTPHPRVRKAGALLAEGVDGSVAIYPDDTRELGATGNTVGRWVTHANAGAFLHLEMAAEVRKSWSNAPMTLVDTVNQLSSDL